jgi:hypothetical protein
MPDDLDDDAITVMLGAEEGDTVAKKTEAKTVDTTDPLEDLRGQFKTMQSTLSSTTQRLAGAEQQIAAKDSEIADIRKEVVVSQADTIEAGILAAENEGKAVEAEYVQAFEAGDAPAMARAQRKMAAVEGRLGRLREAKDDLKEEAGKTTVSRQTPTQRAPSDPVEAVARTLSSASAAWVRAHPDCITDPKKNARMLAAHNLAVADDIPIDTPEYFERIEAGVNPTKTAAPAKEEKKPGAGVRPSSAAAPSGDVGGGMNGSSGATVQLTKREVLAATDGTHVWNYNDPNGKFKKDQPIGVQEFARRKVQMKKEGHYDRSFES